MAARQHDCVGAFLVQAGAVLLGRRRDDCDWLAGAWDVFGGHVEAGESGPQALARELDEELGIEAVRIEYLDCIEGDAPEPWKLRLYLVTQWRGEPRNRQEHAELRWCTRDEAQQRLAGAHARFAPLLKTAFERAARGS